MDLSVLHPKFIVDSSVCALLPAKEVTVKEKEPRMEDRLKVYAALSRLPYPLSYQGKILLAAFVGAHVSLVPLGVYLLFGAPIGLGVALRVLVLALVATLTSTAATLYALRALLAPVVLASEALRRYLSHNQLPELPTGYGDQGGRLMADVQFAVERLDGATRSLGELAIEDRLTGAYNRRAAEERLVDDVAWARRGRGEFTLAAIDLDLLKSINDRFGHRAGDACLRHLAEIIRRNVREGDWVARWGADEFVVGLWGAQESAAQAVLERVRKELRWAPARLPNGEEVHFTISGGVCRCVAGDDARRVYSMADEALYRAKREGRDRIVC
jgi:diguanylate cyclase (GGDEF)-like protein